MEFIFGYLFCLINIAVGYLIIRYIIILNGKGVRRFIDNETSKLINASLDNTQIIYPDQSKEIFEKEGSNIEDLLK